MRSYFARLLLFSALTAFPAGLAAQELHWFDSYDAALEEARRTGKPIFLEYRCSP